MLVAGDVEAAVPGAVDAVQGVGERGRRRADAGRDVRDLERRAAPLGDRERLVEGLDGAEVAVAGVDRVEPAAATGLGGECDQFVGGRGGAERILEARRQAEGALVHGQPEGRDHRALLVRRRRPRIEAERRDAERVVPGEGGDVDGRPGRIQRVEVLAEGRPSRVERLLVAERQVGEGSAVAGRERRRRVPAIADHDRRHTLGDRAAGAGVGEDRDVAVAVDVDEPGRDDEPAGVDHPLGRSAVQPARPRPPVRRRSRRRRLGRAHPSRRSRSRPGSGRQARRARSTAVASASTSPLVGSITTP